MRVHGKSVEGSCSTFAATPSGQASYSKQCKAGAFITPWHAAGLCGVHRVITLLVVKKSPGMRSVRGLYSASSGRRPALSLILHGGVGGGGYGMSWASWLLDDHGLWLASA
jgi:hypothetical protein